MGDFEEQFSKCDKLKNKEKKEKYHKNLYIII